MMLVIFFVLMLAFLAYIFLPLAQDSYWPFVRRGALAGIQGDKKEGLWAISDVDFEYEMGKLTREDYISTRESLKREALHVLERERDLSEKIALKPKREISEALKKDITREVLRICGKKLSS
ncbi:MAG: hypothetical protein GXP46_03085 [Deferribacteres bacterium]|nr:hypothetical protein [Deferribacteres bacterium]